MTLVKIIVAVLGALFVLIGSVIYKIGVSVIAKKIEKHFPDNPLYLLARPRLGAYLAELKFTLKAMPFIYRDLQTDVLNDFVDISHQSLDLDSLVERQYTLEPSIKYSGVELVDRLRNSRRVLFLGSAGIGKSTFQRHSAIKIIERQAEFINVREKPIPFFISLKLVDNSRPNPILNHLLERTPWLNKKTGLRTLIRLANKQRLFFFLDGYDEIQFTGTSGTNFVRDELNNMMRSDSFSPEQFVPKRPTVNDFYNSIANCRIWLTSRKEFFAQHRVKFGAVNRSVGVQALELRGIGDNRLKLIQNIFGRYRKVSGVAHLFSDRFFLQQIDGAADKELREMSENPLWLTVMCYTYARKVIDREDYRIEAASNFYELIMECRNLLLDDLDKYKVRELNEPDQVASNLDRNRYISDKVDFLYYFAAQLFCAEETIKTVFDVYYMEEQVRAYFDKHRGSANRSAILNSLSDRSDSNFAVQLINSGIFVLVDKIKAKELYDFPHRRFREVFAAEYFNSHGFSFLVNNLTKEGLSELLYVFFNRSRFQEDILNTLLEAFAQTPHDEYYRTLIANCLKAAPTNYDPTRSLRQFFQYCIEHNIEFRLPLDVLTNFRFDEDFGLICSKGFRDALVEQDDAALFLCASLLSKCERPRLQELSTALIPFLNL